MQCHVCSGNGKVFAYLNRGDDHSKHTQDFVSCFNCNGTGVVDDDYPKRLVAGETFRRNRLSRNESMFICARRLGVSSSVISAFESGRIISDENLSKIIGHQ